MSDLAETFGVSVPSMSRAVDGLVRKRLATRVEDPEDRRVRRVAITAKGKQLVDTLLVVRQAGMESFAASLTAAQRRKLDAAIDSLMDREDIAEAYRAPEGGGTGLTRYRHLITDDNRKWWTLGAMCFALFMIMLDNTVVNVALPSIQRDLGASISGLEWTINGYTLSFAVLLATGGRLGDIFGRRRMFLFGVVIFALSSATAGLAQSSTDLVLSRVVQGVGAALMMPATLSIVTDAFPPAERGKAMGTWAGVSALALAVGPVVGGFLTEHVSWRAIFYLNIPVAIGAVAAALFAVRESRDTTVGREVDYAGVVTLTGA